MSFAYPAVNRVADFAIAGLRLIPAARRPLTATWTVRWDVRSTVMFRNAPTTRGARPSQMMKFRKKKLVHPTGSLIMDENRIARHF